MRPRADDVEHPPALAQLAVGVRPRRALRRRHRQRGAHRRDRVLHVHLPRPPLGGAASGPSAPPGAPSRVLGAGHDLAEAQAEPQEGQDAGELLRRLLREEGGELVHARRIGHVRQRLPGLGHPPGHGVGLELGERAAQHDAPHTGLGGRREQDVGPARGVVEHFSGPAAPAGRSGESGARWISASAPATTRLATASSRRSPAGAACTSCSAPSALTSAWPSRLPLPVSTTFMAPALAPRVLPCRPSLRAQDLTTPPGRCRPAAVARPGTQRTLSLTMTRIMRKRLARA